MKYFLPSQHTEQNNNQMVECSRNTREAGSAHLCGVSVVFMVCVVVSNIERVCAWLIVGQELLYQLRADV